MQAEENCLSIFNPFKEIAHWGEERCEPMDIFPGDILEMKKEHPCGSRRWKVLRVGMDFRLHCEGCGREVLLPRRKAEKALKKIIRPAENAEGKGDGSNAL